MSTLKSELLKLAAARIVLEKIKEQEKLAQVQEAFNRLVYGSNSQ